MSLGDPPPNLPPGVLRGLGPDVVSALGKAIGLLPTPSLPRDVSRRALCLSLARQLLPESATTGDAIVAADYLDRGYRLDDDESDDVDPWLRLVPKAGR